MANLPFRRTCPTPPGPRRGPALCLLLFAVALAAAGAGCAKARAETVTAGTPPLNVPEPPPRALAPVTGTLVLVPEEPAAPPEEAAPEPAQTPARPSAALDRRAEAAEEPPAAAAPVAAEPPRELRVAPSAEDAALERKVRDTLLRAARELGRVDYSRLSPEGKTQYDESRRLTERAEAALKERNFLFALKLADTAATAAAQLPGR